MTTQELANKITYYATKYYTGQAEISDAEFDKYVEELRSIAPNHPILHTTGWGYIPTLDKASHEFGNVGSLSKYRDANLLNSAISSLKTRIIMPKYDGISCVAYYKYGKISKAVTRGNGIEGTNITDKYLQITRVTSMKIFDQSELTGIRGELVISDDNFNKLKEQYPQYKNSRNAVAGIINSKEMSDYLQYVDFVPYKLQGQRIPYSSFNLVEFLESIREYFPHTTEYIYVLEGRPISQTYLEDAYNLRKGYPCDGVVASTIEFVHEDNGTIDITQYAYKFEDEKATTRVDHIEWNLTRTGKLAPVACIDPVELDGATIKRVTCFNAQYVRDNRIGRDAWVEIQRSGSVIPDIHRVVEESPNFELPKVCPACGEELKWSGTDLICDNPDCVSMQLSRVYQWISQNGSVKGVSWNGYNDIINMLDISSIPEIYENYTADTAKKVIEADNVGSATQTKFFEVINKLFGEIDPIRFFIGLNLKNIGWKAAEELAKANVHILIRDGIDEESLSTELYNLHNFGYSSVATILKAYELIHQVANLVKFQEITSESESDDPNKEIHYFCLTGAMNYGSRSKFCEYVKQYGWEMADIKNSEYLVTNNPDPTSSKGKKAKELGVKIITEDEFLRVIGA